MSFEVRILLKLDRNVSIFIRNMKNTWLSLFQCWLLEVYWIWNQVLYRQDMLMVKFQQGWLMLVSEGMSQQKSTYFVLLFNITFNKRTIMSLPRTIYSHWHHLACDGPNKGRKFLYMYRLPFMNKSILMLQ